MKLAAISSAMLILQIVQLPILFKLKKPFFVIALSFFVWYFTTTFLFVLTFLSITIYDVKSVQFSIEKLFPVVYNIRKDDKNIALNANDCIKNAIIIKFFSKPFNDDSFCWEIMNL